VKEIRFSTLTQQVFSVAEGYALKAHSELLQTEHIIFAILGRPDLFPSAYAEMASLTLYVATSTSDSLPEDHSGRKKDLAWSEELQRSISIANREALSIDMSELTPEFLVYGIFANKDSIGHRLFLNAHYRSELEFDKFLKYMLKRLISRQSGNFNIEDSDGVGSLLKRANALHEAEKYEDALELCNAALAISPSDPDALLLRGNSLFELNRHDEAIDTFDKLLQLESGNFSYSHNKARSLSMVGKWRDALKILDNFDHHDFMNIKQRMTFLQSKINILIAAGKNEESLKYTDEILSIEPDNISALYDKGAALNHLGSHEEAINLFDKVLQADPSYTYALLEKINALEALKMTQKALELCDYVLALDASNDFAIEKKKRLLKNSKKWGIF
jgi:tetratricopeptide (TPR) repeat protein